jgi:hypothetical protein
MEPRCEKLLNRNAELFAVMRLSHVVSPLRQKICHGSTTPVGRRDEPDSRRARRSFTAASAASGRVSALERRETGEGRGRCARTTKRAIIYYGIAHGHLVVRNNPRGRCHAIIFRVLTTPTEYVLWIHHAGRSRGRRKDERIRPWFRDGRSTDPHPDQGRWCSWRRDPARRNYARIYLYTADIRRQ